MPVELNGKQKRALRGAGQRLETTIKVGRNGVSSAFLKAVDELLDQHELIKVKFTEFKDEKKELAAKIVEQTESVLVSQVGHTVVLFRQQADPEKRKIKI
ncbi:MAG: YhbY family RNA-binding protein [Limisphaerales bacterium]